jgi:hypothetical protein
MCASRGVEPRIVVQENYAFSEQPVLFVLDRAPKLIQRFTINL